MRQYVRSIIIIVILLIVALLAFQWKQILSASIIGYRSPLADSVITPTNNTPARHSEKVALVIISGLGNQARQLLNLPNLSRLEETGAVAIAQSKAPAYRQTAWTSLISGAPPAFNNAPLLPLWDDSSRPMNIDSLFEQAAAQGVNIVVAGQADWRDLLSPNLAEDSFFAAFEDGLGDEQVVDFLSHRLDSKQPELWVVQFNQFEALAQSGPETEAYQTAIEQVDTLLAELLNSLDLNNTTVIITADYGHTDSGGYGGPDLAVIEQPLILAGKNVIPGEYSAVSQLDITPTIAVLLGLNYPRQNQGRPLLEMLQLTSPNRAQVMVALARQRLALTEAFLSINKLNHGNSESIETAQDFLQNKNYDGASQLAQLLVNQSEAEFEQAIKSIARQAQIGRGVIVIILALITIIWFAKQRSLLWVEASIAGLMIVAVYHIFYLATGNPYSFSAIKNISAYESDMFLGLALSVLTGVIAFLFLLLLRRQTQITAVLHSSYEMSLMAVIGFFAPALYAFVIIGPSISQLFPDATILFHYFTSLTQTIFMSTAGLFIPLIIVLLNWFIQAIIYGLVLKQAVKP